VFLVLRIVVEPLAIRNSAEEKSCFMKSAPFTRIERNSLTTVVVVVVVVVIV
jgi:hypothetical protein